MEIVSHINPDIDSSTSMWISSRFISNDESDTIRLEKAGDEIDNIDNGIVVDMPSGIKGKTSSATEVLADEHLSDDQREALEPLVEYVTRQDQTGNADGQHDLPGGFPSLNVVLNSLRRTTDSDKELVRKMFQILDGYFEGAIEYKKAQKAAAEADWVGDVAIPPAGEDGPVNGILYEEHDAKAVVFQDGNNLGVVRRDDVEVNLNEVPEIQELIEEHGETDNWFLHDHGFLAAHGTRKSPADQKSEISARQLAEATKLAISRQPYRDASPWNDHMSV